MSELFGHKYRRIDSGRDVTINTIVQFNRNNVVFKFT